MIDIEAFRRMALTFEGASEKPHFDKTSFRVKKIFATLKESNSIACLMLSPHDQSVFCSFDKNIMYPVPNKWGLQGATFVNLDLVEEEMLLDAMKHAYDKCIAK